MVPRKERNANADYYLDGWNRDKFVKKIKEPTKISYSRLYDKPFEQRREVCLKELNDGHTGIRFEVTGTEITILFVKGRIAKPPKENVDWDKEEGKVHLMATLVVNYVPLVFHGWIDKQTLDGEGYVTYDAKRAEVMKEEDATKQAQWNEFEVTHAAWKARKAHKVIDMKLDRRHGKEEKKYLVAWQGYDEKHNTWVWDSKVDERPDLRTLIEAPNQSLSTASPKSEVA